MSLPDEQLAGLSKDVESHERRLAELRDVIRLAQDEVAVHEALLDLARNDRLIASVSNCYDDPDLASQLARDPAEYLRRQEILLPEGVTFRPATKGESATRLTAQLRRGGWEVAVIWDREAGFSAMPDTRRLRQLSVPVHIPAPTGSGEGS